MNTAHPSEIDEWLEGRTSAWVETYKKAMLTPVILRLVQKNQPVTVATLTQELSSTTDWQITERGLYRTVKRLQDSGLITGIDVEAPRTGARRKELSLSTLGAQLLSRIEANLIDLDSIQATGTG